MMNMYILEILKSKRARHNRRQRPITGLLMLVLFLTMTLPVAAQQVVKNFSALIGSDQSSNPSNFAAIGSTVYYATSDGEHGRELWKSDGTAAGTMMVKDINPGQQPSYLSNIVVLNGALFFFATDGINGYELWTSDGITGGTKLLKDINLGSFSSGVTPGSTYSAQLAIVNGLLYFSAASSGVNYELWKSDGSASGTVLVKDIAPGSGPSSPRLITNVNGVLCFVADTSTGTELLRSDGTDAGTFVLQVNPTSQSNPSNFTIANNILYFTADDGTHGRELWKSNGSAVGTSLVKDIRPGSLGSNPTELFAQNNLLVFSASDGTNGTELWTSDGNSSGTNLVKNINPGGSSSPYGFASLNGVIYFTASGVNAQEFWRTDGSPTGTVKIMDAYYYTIISANNMLLLTKNDFTLWKSDGTLSGTTKISDVGIVSDYFALNTTVFYSGGSNSHGTELWKTDGTATGTQEVKNVNTFSPENGIDVYQVVKSGSFMYFVVRDIQNVPRLWRTDGTTAGTFSTGALNPSLLTDVNGALFFVSGTNELWKSDGTVAGTMLVKTFNPLSGLSIDRLKNVDGTLFFNADDGIHGLELWKSDGRPSGTVMVQDITPGITFSSFGGTFASINKQFYFTLDDATSGNELWKSDGTPTGTYIVKDINPGVGSSGISELVELNGKAIFAADDGTTVGTELWISDGTPGGTFLLKDISSVQSSYPYNFYAASAGVIYFRASDGIHGNELWKTDGTAGGTSMVKNVANGNLDFIFYLEGTASLNGTTLFYGRDNVNGEELWSTDGTDSGTNLLKDLVVGDNGDPYDFTKVGNKIYFAASDLTSTNAIWKSDGTSAGTTRVAGAFSIQALTNSSNGLLYFTSDNTGYNLMRLGVDQSIAFNPTSAKYGDPALNPATASSNLPITYTSSNPAVATGGTSISIVGVGTADITASQSGNSMYQAAPDETRTLTVAKGDQTITFASISNKKFGDGTVTLSAMSNTTTPITFTSSNTSVATISGNTMTIVGAGPVTITASQVSTVNYNASNNFPQTLDIGKADQTITFGAIATKTQGDPAFSLTANSSSGLPIVYSVVNGPATVSTNTVTLMGAGTVTIQAAQAGNTNYNVAPNVTRTFCVNPTKPVITVSLTNPETPVLTSSNALGNQWYKDGSAIASATTATYTATQAGRYTVITTVTGCVSAASEVQGLVVTALEKQIGESALVCYPNPAQNELTISFHSHELVQQVRIMDITGRIIHEGGSELVNTPIEIGSYDAGLYLVKVVAGKELLTQKFVKK
jgi:ELWxxDGT repeat protein